MGALLDGIELVLQHTDATGAEQCHTYSGLRLSSPVLIVLAHSGTPSSRAHQLDLWQALNAEITGLLGGHAVLSPCNGKAPSIGYCHALEDLACQKLLIFVGDSKSAFGQQAVDLSDKWAQVVIYQSMVFREVIPDDTDLMVRRGLAEEHWTETAEGEFFNRERGAASLQCPQSLILMRQAMIRDTDPIAMVCIGGMEGVREEAALFTERYDGRHRERRPIFALARTGGAASLLVDSFGTSIRQIDLEIERDIFERPSGEIGGMARFDTPKEDGIAVQPYPLIMQTIIDRIARRDDRPSAHE
jgi:SLOG cluster3 family